MAAGKNGVRERHTQGKRETIFMGLSAGAPSPSRVSLARPFFLAPFTSDRLPRRLDLIEFNCCAPVYTVNFRL